MLSFDAHIPTSPQKDTDTQASPLSRTQIALIKNVIEGDQSMTQSLISFEEKNPSKEAKKNEMLSTQITKSLQPLIVNAEDKNRVKNKLKKRIKSRYSQSDQYDLSKIISDKSQWYTMSGNSIFTLYSSKREKDIINSYLEDIIEGKFIASDILDHASLEGLSVNHFARGSFLG